MEDSKSKADFESKEAGRGEAEVKGFAVPENFAFIYGCDPNMGVFKTTTMISDLAHVLDT